MIAGRLEGKFATAFPERKEEGHLDAAKDEGAIILVADTDMLTDRLWVQIQPFFGQKVMNAFANNGDFFVNSVDNLTGSSDLISIRGRATSQRPFTTVDDMKRAAEESFRGKEQELQQQLSDTERKLAELQSGKSKGNEMILSPEQQSELQSFMQKKVDIRKQLRQVRRSLDEQHRSARHASEVHQHRPDAVADHVRRACLCLVEAPSARRLRRLTDECQDALHSGRRSRARTGWRRSRSTSATGPRAMSASRPRRCCRSCTITSTTSARSP